MKHELFLEQEELAQAHQLGELQTEYRVQVDKTLAVIATSLLFGGLFYLVVGGQRTYPLSLTDVLILLLIFAVGGALVLFRYQHLHVYVYTHGLLYLTENTSQVARWEQIKKVKGFYLDLLPGDNTVLLNDGSQITLPSYISGIGELRSTIKREMANYRSFS